MYTIVYFGVTKTHKKNKKTEVRHQQNKAQKE